MNKRKEYALLYRGGEKKKSIKEHFNYVKGLSEMETSEL